MSKKKYLPQFFQRLDDNDIPNSIKSILKLLHKECVRQGKSDYTQEAYLKWNFHFLKSIKKSWRSVRTKDIQSYLDAQISKGNKPKTLKLKKSAILFLFKEFLKKPIDDLKTPKLLNSKEDIDVPTSEEVIKIADSTQSLRDKLIILVLATTGLRNFELCDLKISDFDFQSLRLMNKVRKGKGGKSGKFIISKDTLIKLKSFVWKRQNQYVFLNKDFQKMTIDNIQHVCRTAKNRAGFLSKRFYPHSYRHFFATNIYYSNGQNMELVRQLMRHSSVLVTQKYIHSNQQLYKNVTLPFSKALSKRTSNQSQQSAKDKSLIVELLLENRELFKEKVAYLTRNSERKNEKIKALKEMLNYLIDEEKGCHSS